MIPRYDVGSAVSLQRLIGNLKLILALTIYLIICITVIKKKKKKILVGCHCKLHREEKVESCNRR